MVRHARAGIADAKRIVVKIGSSSLTSMSGGLDLGRLFALTNALSREHRAGREVILVSSGAIASGLSPLSMAKRPKNLAAQQAAASVGQGLLMARYNEALMSHDVLAGQVLLSADDLIRRTHYRNAQRALEKLLGMHVLPIVNENDTVATHEIRFGDNDRLAALVAHLVHADALVLLSDVDAIYTEPPGRPGSERVELVRGPADLAEVAVGGVGESGVGTGGMATKVRAAQIAAESGIPSVVGSAAHVGDIMSGGDVGTCFTITHRRRSTRLLWLAHLADVHGSVHVDAGAVRALRDGHKSLLAAGIVGVSGEFDAGDPIEIVGPDAVVARGLVNYSSEELPGMYGKSTKELVELFGPDHDREVVHRDDLIMTEPR
nr:glutamate 5-kinase [Spelaeicoccus albus]